MIGTKNGTTSRKQFWLPSIILPGISITLEWNMLTSRCFGENNPSEFPLKEIDLVICLLKSDIFIFKWSCSPLQQLLQQHETLIVLKFLLKGIIGKEIKSSKIWNQRIYSKKLVKIKVKDCKNGISIITHDSDPQILFFQAIDYFRND